MCMVKTSVYLPDELKQRLAEAARTSGESEATIIRSALEQWLVGMLRPRRSPHWGTVEFRDPDLADKVDEVLASGFGAE
jgi:gamma-glutamyl:cysteine ligase YbdK (ATP-grasp superfamily)